MKIAKSKHKNIFCIEGDWTNDMRDTASIKTGLEFLEHNSYSKKKVSHIHTRCSTLDEFESRLKESILKKYEQYGIMYFAFHGNEGKLQIGKRLTITLDEIADILENKAQNKIIHFGSCETLAVGKVQINRFVKKTGALAVSGYSKTIDFIPSTFLDLLYFQFCQRYQKMYLIEKEMKAYYSKFISQLGFKMVYEK